ncbi:hypothetical protein [Candidatus Nitrotoga sp. AM1P]|uniref:hypothetical protein n=1 Tax=Candidatus Nitrotoga sp. AM1P TaxID=2559597 RepID=UPI0015632930|nr:hypothetical protein [Candidatus Nitrotoga sp. AM1P]
MTTNDHDASTIAKFSICTLNGISDTQKLAGATGHKYGVVSIADRTRIQRFRISSLKQNM